MWVIVKVLFPMDVELLMLKGKRKWYQNLLSKVQYVPEINKNIFFSISKTLTSYFMFHQGSKSGCPFIKNDTVYLKWINTAYDLYALQMDARSTTASVKVAATSKCQLWHERLRHQGKIYVK